MPKKGFSYDQTPNILILGVYLAMQDKRKAIPTSLNRIERGIENAIKKAEEEGIKLAQVNPKDFVDRNEKIYGKLKVGRDSNGTQVYEVVVYSRNSAKDELRRYVDVGSFVGKMTKVGTAFLEGIESIQ